jgi:sulfur-oxidizing protein SoxY
MIGRVGRRMLVLGGMAVLAAPARATPNEVAAEIEKLTKGAALRPGHVTLDLAQMVENGNAVGVTVSADPPPGARVSSLHLFAEANPLPNVFHATFGPASFAPRLAARIRLATSQTVIAVAVMDDGTCWSDSVTVMVTLAACLE